MSRTTRAAVVAPLVLAAVALTAPAPAAAAASQAALPPAKQIIDRYIQAIGGRDAVRKRASIRSTGTFEVPAAGLKGDLVLVQTPEKAALTITVPGMGEIVQTYDGSAAWSLNPMQGPRLLEGKELAQMREDAGYGSILRESPQVTSVETVERTTMGGEPCYKVRLTYASGRHVYDCYSIETGLLVAMVMSQDTPGGSVDVTTLVSDWKDFGGLRSATVMRQQAMGQEQVMRLTTIEYDRPDDARAFDPPAPIRGLLEQRKKP